MKLYFVIFLIFFSLNLITSEELERSPVVYFYYDDLNCTENSLYQIAYFDSCNHFSRVEINSTHVIQFVNDEDKPSICTGDEPLSDEQFDTCLTRGNDNMSYKVSKFIPSNHSYIFNISGSYTYTIYPFDSCGSNKYSVITLLNKVYDIDGSYLYHSKSKEGRVESFECLDKEAKKCNKTEIQEVTSCHPKNGYYYTFSLIDPIIKIENNNTDFDGSKDHKTGNKSTTTGVKDVLDPEKNSGVPSFVYDAIFLFLIISISILIL